MAELEKANVVCKYFTAGALPTGCANFRQIKSLEYSKMKRDETRNRTENKNNDQDSCLILSDVK